MAFPKVSPLDTFKRATETPLGQKEPWKTDWALLETTLEAGSSEANEIGAVSSVEAYAASASFARNHLDAVVQVFAKGAFGDLRFQILVGGGQQPHVDRNGRPASHALYHSFLKHSKNLGLGGKTEVADLI